MSEAPEFDEELLANAWKLDPCTYAEKLSEGAWQPYRHLRYMSERITDAVIKGGARIIVDMPPRHGKSEFISNWFCQWYLDMFPEKRVILASYAAEFASEWGGQRPDDWDTFHQFLFADEMARCGCGGPGPSGDALRSRRPDAAPSAGTPPPS